MITSESGQMAEPGSRNSLMFARAMTFSHCFLWSFVKTPGEKENEY